MQKNQKSFFLAASPLFLVLFIDSMGLGLVFPILNNLIVNPSSHFLATQISANMRNFIYGFTISIFMLCWFFGAAFLGDLSDQIGRKKSLMICLLGGFVGYLFSAWGVTLGSVSLMLFGRIIAGFTAGSQAIAQAAVVDLSPPEDKAKNIGLVLFFISIGFIVGPLIGGFLSDARISHWFTFATPFYFAATISFINAGLLWWLFNETFTATTRSKIKLHRAIEIFISAFKHPEICYLSVILLVMIFGWSSFYSFISMYLLRKFNFDPIQVALYMGLMGGGFGLGTGVIVKYCTKYFSLKKNVIVALAIAALASLVTVCAPSPVLVWLSVVPIALTMAVAYSVLLTIFSNQVDEDSQGWIMGITGSIMAFAFGINALAVSILADFSVSMPILIAFLGIGMSSALMWFYAEKPHQAFHCEG